MKTTVELPEDLMRAVKLRAVNEGRRMKDVMADLIRSGLAERRGAVGRPPTKVRLRLVQCAHEARPEEEMTPERVAEILQREEVDAVRRR